MENRLALCSQHLREVEAKLIELQRTPSSHIEGEAARIAEALSFVQHAITAVSQTREKVEGLPEAVKRLGPSKSEAAGAA
jgi:hypothetical protein